MEFPDISRNTKSGINIRIYTYFRVGITDPDVVIWVVGERQIDSNIGEFQTATAWSDHGG